jgi:hypothetical protein
MKLTNPQFRTFVSGRGGAKLYIAFVALFAIAITAFIAAQMPNTPLTTDVSAAQTATAIQENEVPSEVATRQMIDYALNLKAASEFAVFADRGIRGLQNSVIRGNSGNAPRDQQGVAARNALVRSIDALWQLPCTELESTNLTGTTLEPGVFCVNGAELAAGQINFDANGDSSAVFIVRSSGPISTDEGTVMTLSGGAMASNIYFVSRDSVDVATGTIFKGNIISNSDITAEQGATIEGKTLTLGEVILNENTLGQGTGTLQICKAVPAGLSPDITNRIFNFTVTGVAGTIAVPVGSCSNPIDVPIGPQTVTELNTGQTLTGGSFTGGFQLTGVDVITPQSNSTLGLVNFATRTAAVNIAEGGPAQQLTLRFTNVPAITGFVEICKQAAANDPDMSGFFTFTIEGVYTTNTQGNRVLQQFVAPVGQCTGPIAVTMTNQGTGTSGTVRVSELPRAGFFLESARTTPGNREIGTEVLGFIVDANGNVVAAPGGGYITVTVPQGTSPANETLITFVNRSAPGLVKICKIAGPGVPLHTLFRFQVAGFGPTTAGTNPQTAVYGDVQRIVDVRAGAAETGGTCAFVPGFGGGIGGAEFQTFVNGTPVRIWELGVSPANTVPQPAGTLRTSRILSTSGFSVGVFSPNPDLNPGTMGEVSYISRAAVPARGGVVEVEFTNYRFIPAELKVCKIGTGGVSGSFTFDINLVSQNSPNGPIFPAATTSVTATAGPAEQGGFCTIVNAANFPGGGLNVYGNYTIVERAVANTTVTAIACPTCLTGFSSNLATRTATLNGSLRASTNDFTINTVAFTNGPTPVGPPDLRVDYDFDGDGKSDPSVFRSSTGTWWYAASSQGGMARAESFGISTDRIVPADYDNDGKTDLAVYRNGEWHVMGSTSGYRVVNFGIATDIPQAGDFDGDGRADFAVYRPSEGNWYINRSTGGVDVIQFGLSGDIPVAADFDGDGKMDPAVYRDGTWYMLRSQAGFGAVQFGIAGDKPVAADYDGDRRVDQAVYRNGTWHILRSTEGYLATSFGVATDVPVPADYNGDGRTDVAVFRPSNGGWHILRSGLEDASYTSFIFGFGSDTPVPAN